MNSLTDTTKSLWIHYVFALSYVVNVTFYILINSISQEHQNKNCLNLAQSLTETETRVNQILVAEVKGQIIVRN